MTRTLVLRPHPTGLCFFLILMVMMMIVLMTRHAERFKGRLKLSDNEVITDDFPALVRQAFPTVHDVSDRVDTLAALLFRKGLLTKAELDEWEGGGEEDAPDRIGSSEASARGSLDAGYGSFEDGGREDGIVRLRAKSSDVRSRGGTRDWKDESEESGRRGGSEEQNM